MRVFENYELKRMFVSELGCYKGIENRMTCLQFKIRQFFLGLLIKEAALVIYSGLEEDEQYLKYVRKPERKGHIRRSKRGWK